jgi:protoheme IX farnesyltransferase
VINTQTEIPDAAQLPAISYSKAQAFIKLTKFRLSFLVVFSAVISYLTVAEVVSWHKLIAIVLGGFLVTAAANGFNQVIERELDKLMTRTCQRPLPLGILSPMEAMVFCTICALGGIFILAFYTNMLSGLLGALSVVLYAGVYTPLKRVTPFSVFVGAFPGAIPTLIGAVAAAEGFGEITFYAWILFAVQFMWQFPHFWAIAWVSHDDYKKAGFFMLPSLGGRDKSSAFQIVVYTMFLIPVSLMPNIFGLSSWAAGMFTFLCGLFFLAQALTLYLKMDIPSARKLMFGSFLYLPLVQLIIMFGAIWK